jgi:hypothetical protein
MPRGSLTRVTVVGVKEPWSCRLAKADADMLPLSNAQLAVDLHTPRFARTRRRSRSSVRRRRAPSVAVMNARVDAGPVGCTHTVDDPHPRRDRRPWAWIDEHEAVADRLTRYCRRVASDAQVDEIGRRLVAATPAAPESFCLTLGRGVSRNEHSDVDVLRAGRKRGAARRSTEPWWRWALREGRILIEAWRARGSPAAAARPPDDG